MTDQPVYGPPKFRAASQERPDTSGALDVERLARAMEVFAFPPASWPPNPSFMDEIAAEYARLSAQPRDGESE